MNSFPWQNQQSVWVSERPEGLQVVIREGAEVVEDPTGPYRGSFPQGRIVKSYVLSPQPVLIA